MSGVRPAPTPGGVAPYLWHLRPAEWPLMTAHTILGWLLATAGRFPDSHGWLGIGAWVVLLNGGTLALNSAFDRDEGEIAFLRHPPLPPPYLARFAAVLLVAGFAVSWQLPTAYRGVYAVCALMSVAYSVPPVRLKSVAGADWVINMLGFGTLTAYAGWALTGRPLHAPLNAVLWAFTPLFAALYPLTQLYQMDEDLARGDRTLALRLGARHSLTVAVFCTGIAFGMLAMAGWQSGWRNASTDIVRWSAIAIAALAWMAVLLPWYTGARMWSSREHRRGMYHALAAWALTDVAVLLAWAVQG